MAKNVKGNISTNTDVDIFDKLKEIFTQAFYILRDNYDKYFYLVGFLVLLYSVMWIIINAVTVFTSLGVDPILQSYGIEDEETSNLLSGVIAFVMFFLVGILLSPVVSIAFVRAREISWSLISGKEILFDLGRVVKKGLILWLFYGLLRVILLSPLVLGILGYVGHIVSPDMFEGIAIGPISFALIILGVFSLLLYFVLTIFLIFTNTEYVIADRPLIESVRASMGLVRRHLKEVIMYYIAAILIGIVLGIIIGILMLIVNILTCCLFCVGKLIVYVLQQTINIYLTIWWIIVNLLLWQWLKEKDKIL